MRIDSSTARSRELGGELRRIRLASGKLACDVARDLGWSTSKVSRGETGQRGMSQVDLAMLLAKCDADPDDIRRLLELHADLDNGYWVRPVGGVMNPALRSLITQENTACALTNVELQVIPGLAQTEDYARALFHEVGTLDEDAIEAAVQTRMERQNLFSHRRRDRPRTLFYIHEQALRLPVGSHQVMRDQMLHLLLLGNLDFCTIRVVPVSAGARGTFVGPFLLFEYVEHNPVVYVDIKTAAVFLERKEDVATYRQALGRLGAVSLSEGQSRELLAALASEYDLPGDDDDDRPDG
ncbi:Helix-turn-helix domain-containing protein [Amycolatopsis arida]|uniref:Helix-turn-helix domain-containing protein n=1 Tax=Amycolatopsis arida TaxID=587909 RepID=A0A1I5L235_9PSEU|nr:helix-turn-helix transcriptional regulator [Amycolatopsis arida]TDX93552.1 helix-turn-helix protein [Amycolatopsis arida]SFO91337.1 Helix-turn-helix domain-containing protein [Amycolatopsis arida]